MLILYEDITNDTMSAEEAVSIICDIVRDLQGKIRTEMQLCDVWQDTIFQGMHIIPILGKTLALHRIVTPVGNEINQLVEAFRLAAVLYISALRARFGVDTLLSEPLYAGKLHDLLVTGSLVRHVSSSLLPWILAVSYTSNCCTEQKISFRKALMELVIEPEAIDYFALRQKVSRVMWDEELLPVQSQILQTLC
jgi:hypothetical protein